MRTRIAAAALTAAALATALTACSSSGDDDKADPPASNTAAGPAPAAGKQDPAAADKAALTKAVQDYSAAYFKPAADTAGKLLSARCRGQISATVYKAELAQAVATFGHQTIKTVTVDSLAGNMARVTYTYSVPALDQHDQPWVREDGAWHYDAC